MGMLLALIFGLVIIWLVLVVFFGLLLKASFKILDVIFFNSDEK